MNEKIEPIWKYVVVYVVLICLLGFNLGTAFMGLGSWRLALQLCISATQVALIWGIYMHLPKESPVTRIFAFIGLIWFMILVTLTMSDFVSRGWLLFPAKWPATMNFAPPL